MTRAQDPHRPAFHFGSTLRRMFPKGSSMPSELVAVLNDFEKTLASRIEKLMPGGKEDILHLSWMTRAMEQLSVIHTDVKNLSAALDLPVCNWKDKWIEQYFDDSVKLLDIANSFISQIHMLEESQCYLVCALRHLGKSTPEALVNARSSLNKWMELVSLKDPSLQQCSSVLDGFLQTPDLSKTGYSDKEKVLMRAMYGFKVVTLFVCAVFAASFSGSAEKLTDIKVANVYLWAKAFVDVQAAVNGEIMNIWSSGMAIVLKEVKAIEGGVKKLYAVLQDGVDCVAAAGLVNATSDLGKSAEEFSQGLELLLKEVDRFFKVLLSGRNALMGRLRVAFYPAKVDKNKVV